MIRRWRLAIVQSVARARRRERVGRWRARHGISGKFAPVRAHVLAAFLEAGDSGFGVGREDELDAVPAGAERRIGEVRDTVGADAVGLGDKRLLLGLRQRCRRAGRDGRSSLRTETLGRCRRCR